ncbi:MAG: LCP family protein [Patescibacteria group bacterium]
MTEPVKINFISDQKTEKFNSVNSERHSPPPASPAPSSAAANQLSLQSSPGVRPIFKKKKRGKIKRLLASIAIVAVIAFAVFSSSIIFSNENLIKNFTNLNFLGQLGSLIVSSDRPLQGEANDRINFLLMGIGGKEHEAGNLADTMILATYKPSTGQLAMLSLPRDMYVKVAGIGWTKINAVNAYAEKKSPGSGGEETGKFIGELLGVEIDYYAVIDFDGFEKLIDEFGGIDVYVDNNLIDYSYPINGRENDWPIESRYETLNIKKGWQHFDGATALKYSRSRHALGAEGSDFARSKRQQKVLIALKEKISQYNFILDPAKISSLFTAYKENVSTDLEMWEILKLAKIFKNIEATDPINYSLVNGQTPLLYDQIVNDAYVLLPYGGNYDKIGFIWQNIFTLGTSTPAIDYTKWAEFKDQPTSTKATTTKTTEPAIAAKPAETIPFGNEAPTDLNTLEPAAPKDYSYQNEGAKLEIQNGTTIEGWAAKEASRLRAKGFTVTKTGNAATKGYTTTKIYDFSGGKYSLTVSELQILSGVSAAPPPAGLKAASDVLIILGK